MTCPEIYHLYLERKTKQEIHQAYREVNLTDHDEINEGFTPLHLACRFADLGAILLLLERGADVNAKDNRGETPICTLGRCRLENADENELEEAAKKLIAAGAKIHRSGQETTALIEAVRNRHFAMAEAIISSGVKINSANKNGENVLHMACQEAWFISLDREKSANRLKRMRDEGWHPDIKITEAENELARFQEQETEVFRLVKSVLANGTIDPEEKSDAGKRPVDIAMERGITTISALLTGNDPEHDELAALSGGMDVFQALIYKNKTALEAILRMGTDLQRVYEDDQKTSFKGKSPLACALMSSDFMSAEMILKAGADPNWRMPDEKNAFAVWASHNDASSSDDEQYLQILTLMLSRGWNPELSSDNRGNTALAIACLRAGYGPCNTAIRFLLDHGANPNATNNCGQTPLMLLCGGNYWDGYIPRIAALPRSYPYGWKQCGPEEIAAFELLLEAGASITNKDNWGNTILHYLAASSKRRELHQMTEILEEFGLPDIQAVNNEGLSALDVATAYKNDDMIKFLLQNI